MREHEVRRGERAGESGLVRGEDDAVEQAHRRIFGGGPDGAGLDAEEAGSLRPPASCVSTSVGLGAAVPLAALVAALAALLAPLAAGLAFALALEAALLAFLALLASLLASLLVFPLALGHRRPPVG
jgi:hypothetical protein